MQDNPENKNIGENIRLYRIKAGLTIKDLSRNIHRQHGIVIKMASIRNYEKGGEKIPATALSYIASATNTDMQAFYEQASITTLLDNSKVHLIEACCMIKSQSSRDVLLHLARKLGAHDR